MPSDYRKISGVAGDASGAPTAPGRIASALRHFLAASGSVAGDDGDSPTEAAGRGSAAIRLGLRPARAARLRRSGTSLTHPAALGARARSRGRLWGASGRTRNAIDRYHTAAFPSGLSVIVKPMPQAQSVSIGVWVRAGGRYESADQSGISHFLEHLLFKGTRRRSCEELKRQIEGIGGSLNGFTSEEFTCYTVKVPRRFARLALNVLADMVRHPALAAADVEKEREVILEEIRMYEDSPGQYVHDLFNQIMWPEHPLGMLLSGTIDSVRRISRADVVAYWRRMYRPHNLIVACAGAVDPQALTHQAARAFGTSHRAPTPRFLAAPRPRRSAQSRVWSKQTEQTHLCIGTYAVPRTHPDRFALELLHVILGANMSSRLFREVREKRGLVYEIGTHIKRFHDTGAFVVYAGCDASKLLSTVQTIFAELARVRRTPISQAELRRAKDYYAGQLLMGLEDTMDHMLWIGEQVAAVGRVAQPQMLLKRLAGVCAQDIRRVARRLFQAPKMHLAVVGPVAEAEASRLAELCRLL